MRRIIFVLIIIFCISTSVLISSELITDRPDATESSSVVPEGAWQIEAGFSWENNTDYKGLSLGEILVRTSFSDKFEIRIGLNSWACHKVLEKRASGIEDFEFGIKYSFIKDKLALILMTSLPAGHKEFSSDSFIPSLVLAFSQDISDRVSFGLNFGFDRNFEESVTDFFASAVIGLSLTEKTGLFIEYAGEYLDKYRDNHFFHTGITYLLEDNIQMDLRVKKGLGANSDYWLIGTGISLLFI